MLAIASRKILLPPGVANPTGWAVLAKSAVAASGAADTNENALATIAVPAGAMGPNGMLRVTAGWSFTNSANNKVMRTKLGATVFQSSTVTTVNAFKEHTIIMNRGAANAQIGNPTSIGGGGWNTGTSGHNTGVIDTSAAQNLTLTGQKASAGETLTLEWYVVEVAYGA